jgi:glyoxylase-like metal-dependent hydrolase (beta-lactamase superfamily II)
MSRREYEFWTGPMACRPLFAALTREAELDHLASLMSSGRLSLTGSSYTAAPGVELVEVGGHTPGQLAVVVSTGEGTAVLASDALHYYEELERDRPFAVAGDLPGMYRAFDVLRDLGSGPRNHLVAGHDPAVRTRFAEVDAAGGGILRIAGSRGSRQSAWPS